MPTAETTDDYRLLVRQSTGPHYSGALHFAFTSACGLAGLVWALTRLHSPSAAELLAVPATFLYANLVEYLGHKGPMHHPVRLLRLVYQRHTLMHHRFFTRTQMELGSARDFYFVLFPPILIVFFFGLFAAPIGFLLARFTTPNVAALFVATAMGYFLCYEWLHLSYHLPEGSALGRLPLVQRLRRHHQLHHDPALMTRCNFNITFPLCDTIFGTTHREEA